MTARLAAVLGVAVSAAVLWASPSAASWCTADIAALTVDPAVCDRYAANERPRRRDVAAADLVWVEGIRVHRSIGGDIAALVAAAADDGIAVAGGGYRSYADQVHLRRAHCGPSVYDVWLEAGWRCDPPTARPGHSMHQQGLAVDFTTGGAPIDETDPLFVWLTVNADRFGLRNFSKEPWHWSTNGR